MTEQDLKGLIASELIIVATETKGKMPSKLNFTELIDVVTDVVKNCSIHVVSKSFKNKKRTLTYMGIDKWGKEVWEYLD